MFVLLKNYIIKSWMSVVCFSLRQGEAFKEHLLKEEHEPHALKGLVLHLKLGTGGVQGQVKGQQLMGIKQCSHE